jgi:hypothetical protein
MFLVIETFLSIAILNILILDAYSGKKFRTNILKMNLLLVQILQRRYMTTS